MVKGVVSSAMTKFHINKHGVPAPCKAKKGRCPLGTSDAHFESQEKAEEYIKNLSEEQFGLLGDEVRNETTVQNYDEYYEHVLFSGYDLSYKGELIENNYGLEHLVYDKNRGVSYEAIKKAAKINHPIMEKLKTV